MDREIKYKKDINLLKLIYNVLLCQQNITQNMASQNSDRIVSEQISIQFKEHILWDIYYKEV